MWAMKWFLVLLFSMGVPLSSWAKCWSVGKQAPVICAELTNSKIVKKDVCVVEAEIAKYHLLDVQDAELRGIPYKPRAHRIWLNKERCDGESLNLPKWVLLEEVCNDKVRPGYKAYRFRETSQGIQFCRAEKKK